MIFRSFHSCHIFIHSFGFQSVCQNTVYILHGVKSMQLAIIHRHTYTRVLPTSAVACTKNTAIRSFQSSSCCIHVCGCGYTNSYMIFFFVGFEHPLYNMFHYYHCSISTFYDYKNIYIERETSLHISNIYIYIFLVNMCVDFLFGFWSVDNEWVNGLASAFLLPLITHFIHRNGKCEKKCSQNK